MSKDPICGMEVDMKTASEKKLLASKDGKTYYFCSEHCKKKFIGKAIPWDKIASVLLVGISIYVVLKGWMLPFMGIVFFTLAGLKFLDIEGFANMFRQYDPIAKVFPTYGLVYPFIEFFLGTAYILNQYTTFAAWVTVFVMAFGVYGVGKSVYGKENIQCACLGSKIKVPLTTFTIVEDVVMLIMAAMLLI